MTPEEIRTTLRDLLRREAVLHGDFVLSSGARSTYYLDARLVTLSGAGSRLVGLAFLDALRELDVDGVAGLTLGADPIISTIAALSSTTTRSLDGFIIRKQRKEHGAGRQIEGPWRTGVRVAVVDDTLTTGASSLEAAAAVERDGGVVVGVYCLIDREQGAAAAIKRAGYPFTALFTAAELLVPTT